VVSQYIHRVGVSHRVTVAGSEAGSHAGRPPQGTIVVGFDRQPVSRRALEVAADLAARLGARLDVVHVVDLSDYPIDPERGDWEHLAREALAEEQRVADDVLATREVQWTYHAARGEPVHLLTTVADEQDALMIVVGTRGHSPLDALGRLLEGSVTRGLTGRGQHRPVLMVPLGAHSG
jgi:nucleotide-binding universal stress UspA family protein